MKSVWMSTIAGLALTGAAGAADLPRRAAPPPVFTPVFTWTGFYAGFNAGYGFDASDRRNGFVDRAPAPGLPAGNPIAFPGGVRSPLNVFTPATGLDGRTVLFNREGQDGFSGGAQIGYNYQFTPGSGLLVGIEADAQYLDFGRSRRNGITFTSPPAVIDPTFTPINGGLSALDFFGTLRGRVGYAFDRTLVFATGGFAYGSGDNQVGNVAFTQAVIGGRDGFRTGWTAGGGVEYALPTDSFLNFFRSSAVTLKVEGLYVNLERSRSNLSLIGATTFYGGVLPAYDSLNFNGNRSDEFAVVRAGLNYKFGSY